MQKVLSETYSNDTKGSRSRMEFGDKQAWGRRISEHNGASRHLDTERKEILGVEIRQLSLQPPERVLNSYRDA